MYHLSYKPIGAIATTESLILSHESVARTPSDRDVCFSLLYYD
ncbi:MAG: hypothetical protein ACM37W_16810 [Actinomycetota bacterium]